MRLNFFVFLFVFCLSQFCFGKTSEAPIDLFLDEMLSGNSIIFRNEAGVYPHIFVVQSYQIKTLQTTERQKSYLLTFYTSEELNFDDVSGKYFPAIIFKKTKKKIENYSFVRRRERWVLERVPHSYIYVQKDKLDDKLLSFIKESESSK